MLKRKHYIVLALIVVVVVVLFKLPGQTIGKLKLAITGLFLPAMSTAGAARDVSTKTGNALTSKGQLLRENDQLRQENNDLKFQLQQAAAVVNENARLNQLLGLPRKSGWRWKAARVIAREPASWWRSVQIDVGLRDGVSNNAPVLTADGLVGRISAVGDSRSQVILLGDPNLRVAAMVENHETGIIMTSSSYPQDENMVDLGYLAGSSKVLVGQTVFTWGEGGYFSAGIPIGKIVDSKKNENGLTTEARVRLFNRMGALEEVWVMLPGEAAPAPAAPAPNIPVPAAHLRAVTPKKK